MMIGGRSERLLVVVILLLSCILPNGQSFASSTSQASGTTTNSFNSTHTNRTKAAKLKVSGYGILGNRELKRILTTLELGGKMPEVLASAFVEDAALILTARVKSDGFLEPSISIELVSTKGESINSKAEELLENPLPREMRFREVRFRIQKGRLYFYESLEFEGLESISDKEARDYFMDTTGLFALKHNKIYTPERLRRGVNSLKDLLDRQGYQQAVAQVSELERDDKTGAVRGRIVVHQGLKSIVRSVREEIFEQNTNKPIHVETIYPNKAYSSFWLQDFRQSLKTNDFRLGYPDVTVEVRTLGQDQQDRKILIDLLATINRGPQVRVGAVEFKGQKRTRESLLSRRVRIRRGELLNRIRVEEGRFRLAQLGSFDNVDLSYVPVDERTRNIIYQVKEGKEFNVSLLFGYGSYELLRGGFEIEQYNIWGRAHRARLKVIQSFKASSADFTYTMPESIGNDVDVFANANWLRREEISFTRLEYGGGFGAHKYYKPLATDITVRYSYQILNASEVAGIVTAEGVTNTAVGAIITELKHDRRDNPLYPRKGYKIFGALELASEYLAGEVNYQRLDLSSSWHHSVGGGRFVSLGLSHGVVLTGGSPAQDLPFNRRFFPGGQNSIRGYQEGEASPRDAQGRIIGAETYLLGTIEFEQSLTPKWSLVLFSDSLGFAREASHYPFDTGLFSVGGGLRWRTIIGPVRLEYGYNLNPRPRDPTGTLQFSLGFPF
jgi:outer membrane protein insertion porin family